MSTPSNVESDPRFPSGKWVGFFLDRRLPGKHQMEMTLTFAGGTLTGTGRDRVGSFTFAGTYDVVDGQCVWEKKYVSAHALDYRGFNEGKGIWGTWSMSWQGLSFTGGFHIWPDGMADPTQPVLDEEADVPFEIDDPDRVPELEPVGV